jgi:hypothetical protein
LSSPEPTKEATLVQNGSHDPAGVVNEVTGRDLPCPCCDHTVWRQFDDQPVSLATKPARPTDYGGWLAGFFAVRFYCERCGFVRLHVVSPEQTARSE